MTHYDDHFFEHNKETSVQSAASVVPLVLDLLKPGSVVDVGCGIGTWLSVFKSRGVEDIQGYDGPWVKRENLLIPPERFEHRDLTQPLKASRRFDLVVSLEVAEHLDAKHADAFVASLVGLGSLVLFSAAVPFQGGEHHVNEQWLDYWIERFEVHGYVPVDALRPLIWNRREVGVWYRQNMVFFAHDEALRAHPALAAHRERNPWGAVALVHPDLYVDKARQSFLGAVKSLPTLAWSAVARRLSKRS